MAVVSEFGLPSGGQLPEGLAQVRDVSDVRPLFRRVAEQLIGAIEAGHYPVGSMLPKEKELAQVFGVSRSSVREALSCLQFEGYVETRHGSGTVVISAVDRASYGVAQDNDLGQYSAIEIMEMRLIVEPEVVAIASREPVSQHLRELKRILMGMERDIEGSIHGHSDLVVHSALIKVCPNRLLVGTAQRLIDAANSDAFKSARHRSWDDPVIPKEWLMHHQSIVTAVLGHDALAAKAAYVEHLLSVLEQLIGAADLGADDMARADRLIRQYRL